MFMESYMWRGNLYKKCCLCESVQRRMDSWVVGENRDITVAVRTFQTRNFNFYKSCFTEIVWDYICSVRKTAVGGEESRGQAPQDRFGFLWISTTAFNETTISNINVTEHNKNVVVQGCCDRAHICLRLMVDIRYNLKSWLPEGNVKWFFKVPLKRFVFTIFMSGQGLLAVEATLMTRSKAF